MYPTRVAKNNPEWYWGMGLTAEAVAKEFNMSREDQDAFAVESHARAAAAIDSGACASGIAPITVNASTWTTTKSAKRPRSVIDTDEGVRRGTNAEALAKLRPSLPRVARSRPATVRRPRTALRLSWWSASAC